MPALVAGIHVFLDDAPARSARHPGYAAHRTASTRIAIAATHEPATLSTMPCRQRAIAEATKAITASAPMALQAVPISIATASWSKIDSGGESSPRAIPDTSATGTASATGTVACDAAIRPHRVA